MTLMFWECHGSQSDQVGLCTVRVEIGNSQKPSKNKRNENTRAQLMGKGAWPGLWGTPKVYDPATGKLVRLDARA